MAREPVVLEAVLCKVSGREERLKEHRGRRAYTRSKELPIRDWVAIEEVGCISLVRSVS